MLRGDDVPRLTLTSDETTSYRTIKELVIQTCLSLGRFPQCEELTALVKEHFPRSKWDDTHCAWYKSQIKNGHIVVPGFSSGTGIAETDALNEGGSMQTSEAAESIEAGVSLERDLHSYLATRVDEIESGMTLVEQGVEYLTEVGRIDLLARDANGRLVVIELKAGRARDAAIGQLLGYIGCFADAETEPRGILIASSFDSRVVVAARGLANIRLMQYRVSFRLEEIA